MERARPHAAYRTEGRRPARDLLPSLAAAPPCLPPPRAWSGRRALLTWDRCSAVLQADTSGHQAFSFQNNCKGSKHDPPRSATSVTSASSASPAAARPRCCENCWPPRHQCRRVCRKGDTVSDYDPQENHPVIPQQQPSPTSNGPNTGSTCSTPGPARLPRLRAGYAAGGRTAVVVVNAAAGVGDRYPMMDTAADKCRMIVVNHHRRRAWTSLP